MWPQCTGPNYVSTRCHAFKNQPHGLSKGSDAPKPLPGLVAAGVAAEVHPPKSSSAVTVGCTAAGLLDDDIGAPQPPAISFGVILEGTLPSSTFGCVGFAGSAVAQALLSAPPHGSNIPVLD